MWQASIFAPVANGAGLISVSDMVLGSSPHIRLPLHIIVKGLLLFDELNGVDDGVRAFVGIGKLVGWPVQQHRVLLVEALEQLLEVR